MVETVAISIPNLQEKYLREKSDLKVTFFAAGTFSKAFNAYLSTLSNLYKNNCTFSVTCVKPN